MIKKLKFKLDIEVEIDGEELSDKRLHEILIEALNNAIPSVVECKDFDCAVIVEDWNYSVL